MPDGKETSYGRIERSNCTWDEEFQVFTLTSDVEEYSTRSEDISLDYEFYHSHIMPLECGYDYGAKIIPRDINIWISRLFLGDSDGFSILYEEWEYVGLYYDEGITGTKKDVRAGLLSMIADCEDGKIEFIITKSISRFARNTTDCLEMVRKLTDLGISIFFEKENINTGSMESELMLSILSSLAESESVSISENSKWSVQKRFQNGTFIIAYPPYGYDNDNGTMVIVPEQAEIVKEIFAACLAGKGTHAIAKELNARGIKTKKNGKWGAGAINAILTNEKYTGDVIFQKTYSDSNFNRHINYGERDRFLCENHHEPIISHEEFEKVRMVLDQRAMEKATVQIPTDIRSVIVSPEKSNVANAVLLLSVGSITSQVAIM